MKHLPTVARVLLGLLFFVFGLNGFLKFIDTPPLEGHGLAFMGALAQSKMLMVIKVLEIGCGALLLLNKKVPLALTVLTPIIVVIFLFHVFMSPRDLPISIFALSLAGYLIWNKKLVFTPVLAA